MECKSSGSVVCSCRYHVVFCPKCRRPVLVDGVDGRFRQMAEQVAGKLSFDIIEMEAMPGHVHMLLEVDPQLGIHRAVKRIKGRASHGLRAESPWPRARIPAPWTSSHFVSAVGGAPLAVARQCIESQKSVQPWRGPARSASAPMLPSASLPSAPSAAPGGPAAGASRPGRPNARGPGDRRLSASSRSSSRPGKGRMHPGLPRWTPTPAKNVTELIWTWPRARPSGRAQAIGAIRGCPEWFRAPSFHVLFRWRLSMEDLCT